jgi:nitrate reductase alpha subunit
MGHVILKEHFVDKRTARFEDYMRRYTDAPYLVTLAPHGDSLVPGKFLTAKDLGGKDAAVARAEFKTVLLDQSGSPVVPNGSLGHRFTPEDEGLWNLDLGEVVPPLSLSDLADTTENTEVLLPRFDLAPEPGGEHTGGSGIIARGVPVRRVAGRLVTTVFDLLLAQYGVARPGLPGQWPTGYDDPSSPGTPAWQEEITSVPAAQAMRIGREFADNADRSGGRSMILMGAGTNHWFHSDTIYRTFLRRPPHCTRGSDGCAQLQRWECCFSLHRRRRDGRS